MLTTLDTTRLVPRQQDPQIQPGSPNAQLSEPVFTIGEIVDLLENRPEIRDALRQSLVEFTQKESQSQQ